MSSKTISKEDVFGAIMDDYYDDLEFIEALNNLTYNRKVQLKRMQYEQGK